MGTDLLLREYTTVDGNDFVGQIIGFDHPYDRLGNFIRGPQPSHRDFYLKSA